MVRQGGNITLMWTPAHSGVLGNEKADKSAKEAIRGIVEVNFIPSKSEGKAIVRRKVNQQWQQHGDNTTKGRHLQSIQNRVCMVRRTTTVKKKLASNNISRLRVGHSNRTLFIIGKHQTDICNQCQGLKRLRISFNYAENLHMLDKK